MAVTERDRPESKGLLGSDLVATLRLLEVVLEERREHINRINVFPVADRDTGSNLLHTIASINEKIDEAEDLSGTAESIVSASLYAGRGASGLILSQALAGLCEHLGSAAGGSASVLAASLGGASVAARAAVGDPVEGTILTAISVAATRALEAADAGGGLLDVCVAARDGAWAAVADSPRMLPVLAEAGVVDGGAVGFGLLMDALFAVVDDTTPMVRALPGGTAVALDLPQERHEIVAIVTGADAGALRAELGAVANSVAIGGRGSSAYVHCHTANAATVLSILALAGIVEQVDITDLHRQAAPTSESSVVAVAPSPGHVLNLLDAAPDRVMAPADDVRLTQLLESGSGGPVRIVLLREPGSVVKIPERSEGTVEVVTVDSEDDAVAAIRRRH